MIQLNDAQRIQLASGKAVDVTDEPTSERYVVMSVALFERLRHLLIDDNDWSDDELRWQLSRSAKENGWEEPAMDLYDRYDEEMAKRCK